MLYYNQTEKGSFDGRNDPGRGILRQEDRDHRPPPPSSSSRKLTLVKEASVNGGAYSTAHANLTDGDTVAYRLSVKNTGTSPAYDVAVADKPSSKPGSDDADRRRQPTSRRTRPDEIAWTVPGPVAVGETVKLGYTAKLVPVDRS